MAVTSIWRVKGWLGKVVLYVENPDKTENPAFVRQSETGSLSDVIRYAVDSGKTCKTDNEQTPILHQFVSGVNCCPATAREEMMAVKKRFGKEGGTVAYHGYQSFAPGEASPEMAHAIGVKLAQRLWGEKYQVIVATHLDRESHLHNHFVLNTVSFQDGIKYHRTRQDYLDMQRLSDELCREYSLSVIEDPQTGSSMHYGEWRAQQEGRSTWRGLVKADIDEAIRQAMTERQFFDILRKKGYEIKGGKELSIRPPGKERFFRPARQLGADYTVEQIRRRILGQCRPERPMPPANAHYSRCRLKGKWSKAKKVTGFRALYFHYCYLLGVFPRKKSQNKKQLHFLLREDLIRLENITQEVRLLAVHRIDTAEQLSSYKGQLETGIEAVTQDRKQLYRKQRTVAVQSDEAMAKAVKAEISRLNSVLAQYRREVKLCDDIAVRSGVMLEKIKAVREDEQNNRKENTRNEQFRRRSGTGRAFES